MPEGENITIKVIYDEILKNRSELKNVIEASETRMLLKIEELNNRLSKTEKENQILREKVEKLERQAKKNNIIIFGIKERIQEISTEYICQTLNGLLEINLSQHDISDIYPLGKSENRPIKIELTNNIKKKAVLKNCYKLKGKEISIAPDLTIIQREENKILKTNLIRAREKKEKSYIKGNKLFVNDTPFTAEELVQLEENKYQKQTLSAPATPDVQKNSSFIENELALPTHSRQIDSLEELRNSISQEKKKVFGKVFLSTPKNTKDKHMVQTMSGPKNDKIVTRSTGLQKK